MLKMTLQTAFDTNYAIYLNPNFAFFNFNKHGYGLISGEFGNILFARSLSQSTNISTTFTMNAYRLCLSNVPGKNRNFKFDTILLKFDKNFHV